MVQLLFFYSSTFVNSFCYKKEFFLYSERVIVNFYLKKKMKKQILFSLLFTMMTKNKIITIFIYFSTFSSKCKKTPQGCKFFIQFRALPSPPIWELSTRFITTPLTIEHLLSQCLDPALPKHYWFTPTFPTCLTVAE